MNNYKKCKVVMLTTNQKSDIWLRNDDKPYLFSTGQYCKPVLSYESYQHLYILSDDEIKEGDLYLVLVNDLNEIHQRGKNDKSGIRFIESNSWVRKCKKIIATTDSSLRILKSHAIHEVGDVIKVPLIPQSFIDKYVSEYNKGNKIEEVMVEYKDNYARNEYGDVIASNHYLKLNPNNTINIQSIKDSWTREEVIKIIHKFNYSYSCSKTIKSVDNWIENNL